MPLQRGPFLSKLERFIVPRENFFLYQSNIEKNKRGGDVSVKEKRERKSRKKKRKNNKEKVKKE
jgi:hypothetical protein